MGSASGSTVTRLMICLTLASCAAMPVIDLSSATFPAVGFKPISAPGLFVTVAPDAVSKRQYTSGSFNYLLAYSVGDAERRYAQAVAHAVFSDALFNKAPAAARAELRLTSFTHILIPRATGTLPDVTDEVTAKWTLISPTGAELRRFVFVGSESGATRGGLAPAQAERGQARASAAIQALYRQTVEGLGAAPEIARVGVR